MTTTLNPYLSGNFAPVQTELTVDELPVLGELPPELNGFFVRNGPNPQFPPPR
ncbi:carotenoid oxygenase family protein [Geitlerinema splendidum]|nr:carotenoid oxygenase family protein [Geitlerinema splendidum]